MSNTESKQNIFLPQTSFGMRANLPSREPEILERWNRINIYNKLRQNSQNKEKFILHSGPPFANGDMHMGHALNFTLKDVVVRSYQMLGFDAPMVPGWDCHGLPIEWKIEELYKEKSINKDTVSQKEFRQQCRDFAQKWIPIQKNSCKRLGVMADWENPYSTMDFSSEATIVKELFKFVENDALYRGAKPVLWSTVEKTALAEAEVEYKDKESPSIFVRFKIDTSDIKDLENTFAVIWTTTPWTLPGNRGIAYGNDVDYHLIRVKEKQEKSVASEGECYLIACDLTQSFTQACGIESFDVVKASFKGELLSKTIAKHPWNGQGYDFNVPLVPAEHVTTETGTGLVHMGPAHGLDDFLVAQKYGLEIPETVSQDGTYYEHIPVVAGLHIFKSSNQIIELLGTSVLSATKIKHSYPHSWRSKAPLIYRATAQWFISMEKNDLRKKALDAIEQTKWHPEKSRNRITAMIQDRPDWCISRQRSWGVPIPLFVHKKTHEILKDRSVFERIIKAIEEHGADAWYDNDPAFFLSPHYDASDYEQVKDIIDVWFESGTTHAFVLEKHHGQRAPADLYLEGSDQHRGWFQSSLLVSVATRNRAPYKNVMTHGFIVDDNGFKMSKSSGNSLSPQQIIEQSGADILRLWVISSDYSQDLKIGKDILKQQEDVYRRLRNTLRFLLGNLHEFDEKEIVDYAELPDLEKWVLSKLYNLSNLVIEKTKVFDFHTIYNAIHNFCTTDLSAFYFDIRKDSLYCDKKSSHIRRSTRTVLDILFKSLCKWLAPVLCFTCDEAWLARYENDNDSVHLHEFETHDLSWSNEALEEKFENLRSFRKIITGALEIKRAEKFIGSSLQAHVEIFTNEKNQELLSSINIEDFCIVSSTSFHNEKDIKEIHFKMDDVPQFAVNVLLASGKKCERCWKVLDEVEQSEHNLCNRCGDAV